MVPVSRVEKIFPYQKHLSGNPHSEVFWPCASFVSVSPDGGAAVCAHVVNMGNIFPQIEVDKFPSTTPLSLRHTSAAAAYLEVFIAYDIQPANSIQLVVSGQCLECAMWVGALQGPLADSIFPDSRILCFTGSFRSKYQRSVVSSL